MRLQDKVAIVTGGASGIGLAMARRFAQEGAIVYVADIAEDLGRSVAAELGGAFVKLDVSSETSWSTAMAQVHAEHEKLDILVNNAGISSHQSIDVSDLESWNRVIGVNLTGVMLGCRNAIEAMRANPIPGGAILNTASTTGLLATPYAVAYSTSKSAVMGLTRSAALRCAQQGWNIRVNSIVPGVTETALLGAAIDNPAQVAAFNAMSPLGRIAAPEEIASLALFLVSDEASYCTGGAYIADGGLSARHP